MSNFKINRSPGFAVEIAGVLRRSIENDTYKKGARLPTERELCEEFGVSRAVIREATTILAAAWGVIVLGERDRAGVRLAAAAAVAVGAILLAIDG